MLTLWTENLLHCDSALRVDFVLMWLLPCVFTHFSRTFSYITQMRFHHQLMRFHKNREIETTMQHFVKIERTRFLRWSPSTMLDFQFSNLWSPIGLKCASPYKFRQNRSNGCWNIVFNNFQNGSVRHLGLLNIWFFEQPVSSGELMCVIMQNFLKIGNKEILEISQFFDFQDGCRLPSWIFTFLNIWSPVRLGGLICRAKPNYTKISHGCWDITFNIFQNGGRPPFWIF